MAERKIWKGNEAVAEAAILAGCDFYAGYPITPQNEVMELLSWKLPKAGKVFVQAESELGAINMVKGASGAGGHPLTATSAPGLALMQEGIASMTTGRYPCVIVDMQRAGDFINPAQYDYNLATKAVGHSGLRVMAFSASTVQEMMDITIHAFQKAFQYRTPVYLLFDGMLGQMLELAALPDSAPPLPDGSDWVLLGNRAGRRKRALVDSPAMSLKGALGFNANEKKLRDLEAMVQQWEETEVMYEEYCMEDAEYVITSYGSPARTVRDAVDSLRAAGIRVGMFRAISLSPFPKKQFAAMAERGIKGILTVEMAIPPQFYCDVALAVNGAIPVKSYTRAGGNVVVQSEIETALREMI